MSTPSVNWGCWKSSNTSNDFPANNRFPYEREHFPPTTRPETTLDDPNDWNEAILPASRTPRLPSGPAAGEVVSLLTPPVQGCLVRRVVAPFLPGPRQARRLSPPVLLAFCAFCWRTWCTEGLFLFEFILGIAVENRGKMKVSFLGTFRHLEKKKG